MKTLEQIKDEVAVEFGYKDFEDMNQDPKRLPIHSLMKRYGKEAIKADRERVKNELLKCSFPVHGGRVINASNVQIVTIQTEIILP